MFLDKPTDKAERKSPFVSSGNLKYIVAYIATPNIVFAILGIFMFLSRPVVVVDYALVAPLTFYISRLKSVVLLISIFAIDVAFSIAPTYHMQGGDFLTNAYAVFLMSWPPTLLIVIFVLILGVVFFKAFDCFLSTKSRASFGNVIVVLSIVVFLLLADIVNSSNVYIPSPYNFIGLNISGSNFHKLISTIYKTVIHEDKPPLGTGGEITVATSALRDEITTNEQMLSRNILVVVVESWGQPISGIAQNLLIAPFDRDVIRSRYSIRTGEVAFRGSTVPGEVRELCGQTITSPGQVNAVSMYMCLPNLLRSKGYETTAIHGFSRHMFNRQQWYPTLGFERLVFADDLELAGYTSRCGHVFRGSCDSDSAAYVRQLLSKKSDTISSGSQRPQFIYWLTLNTHLPVARDTSIQQKIDCSVLADSIAQNDHEEPCRLTEVLLGTLTLVADIAEKSDGDLHVIVVGDHAPPFVFVKDRGLFTPGVVPFVELRPKIRKHTDD